MMRTASAQTLRDALRASENDKTLEEFLKSLSATELQFVLHDWELWARDDQLPPPFAKDGTVWTTWLILGGRGAGKTRAGAEWVRARVLKKKEGAHERIALIGETLGDVRAIMVEGISGLLAIHKGRERPKFEPSKRQLVWPNGAVAQMFSAEDPESLRGPQFSAAWCDELAKWRHADAAWDMLQFGLRLGNSPQQVVTTTPRPVPLLKRLLNEPKTVTSRARTTANAANLAPAFLETIVRRYQGTRLGRQELDAEILEDRPDALWQRKQIDKFRIAQAPELGRIVVAVDPPVTSGKRADACGIVAAGLGGDGRAYVLADATIGRARPTQWAEAAIRTYKSVAADCLLAEVNQGGELVTSVIAQVDATVPVRTVHASRGKWLRAEPVAALYEQSRVSHVGCFPALEDQMCDFARDGLSGGGSPDRVDALVWALTELMLRGEGKPSVRVI